MIIPILMAYVLYDMKSTTPRGIISPCFSIEKIPQVGIKEEFSSPFPGIPTGEYWTAISLKENLTDQYGR
jgi:hypothetical protein